jgi:hypothetical protein
VTQVSAMPLTVRSDASKGKGPAETARPERAWPGGQETTLEELLGDHALDRARGYICRARMAGQGSNNQAGVHNQDLYHLVMTALERQLHGRQ